MLTYVSRRHGRRGVFTAAGRAQLALQQHFLTATNKNQRSIVFQAMAKSTQRTWLAIFSLMMFMVLVNIREFTKEMNVVWLKTGINRGSHSKISGIYSRGWMYDDDMHQSGVAAGSVAGSLATVPPGAGTDQLDPIQKSKNVEMLSLSWGMTRDPSEGLSNTTNREKYALLLERYRRNYIENRTSGTLVVGCWKSIGLCGGLADRLKGIITVFNIAVYLNMKLLLAPIRGNFFHYFSHNHIDWTMLQNESDAVCKDVLNWIDRPYDLGKGFPSNFSRDSVICIATNRENFPKVAAMLRRISSRSNIVDPLLLDMVEVPQLRQKLTVKTSEVYYGARADGFGFLFNRSPVLNEMVQDAKRVMGWQRFQNILALHLRDTGAESGQAINNDTFALEAINCALTMEKRFGMNSSATGWYVPSSRQLSFTDEHNARCDSPPLLRRDVLSEL